MTTYDEAFGAEQYRAFTRRPFGRARMGWLRRLVDGHRQAQRERAAYRLLGELSPHLLRDIGFEPSQVPGRFVGRQLTILHSPTRQG